MSMREAFDIFFENNNKSWRRTWGTLPRVPRCDKYRQSSLIVAENDKFDELEWLPKLQEKRIDFNSLEEDLEFRIHPQIKDFLSTYWFMPLEGKTDKIDKIDLDRFNIRGAPVIFIFCFILVPNDMIFE